MRCSIVALSLLGLAAWQHPAHAGSATYFVSIYADAGAAEPIYRGFDYTPGPRSEPYTEGVDPVYYESAPGIAVSGSDVAGGSALANRGVLKVASHASQTAQGGTLGFYGTVAETQSRAEYSFDDVIIRPVGPSPPVFALVGLRLALDGLAPNPTAGGNLYDTFLATTFPNEVFATVIQEVQLLVTLQNEAGTFSGNSGGSFKLQTETTYAAGTTTYGPFVSGVFGSHGADVQSGVPFVAELPFIGVPVGEPLTLTVSLMTRCQSGFSFYQNGGIWQSLADVHFDRTLSFAPDYVASLPAGVTLDSVEAGIDDNVWTPVPEPDAQLLRLAVVSVLGFTAQGRRSNRR